MSIGLFVDGSFVYKSFPDQMDYMKLRQMIEKELSDTVDEAYFFNSDDDPPKAAKFNNYLTVPPPNGPGFRLKIYWLSKKKLFWPQSLGGHPILHPTDPSIQFELVQQKGVDVGLAYHMVRSFYKWGIQLNTVARTLFKEINLVRMLLCSANGFCIINVTHC